MKTYVIDIDGTICTNTFGEYKKAEPFYDRIAYINKLFSEGNIIKFFTARGSSTKIDWTELTKKQLSNWKVNYHELIMGKPEGDIFIDDKAFNSEKWIWNKNTTKPNEALEDTINNFFKKSNDTLEKVFFDKDIIQEILKVSRLIKNTFKIKGRVFIAGNGGSFSDAQHIAAEFVCKYKTDRLPLPAVALGTNSSNLTAIGNDYGFEYIFSRELQSLASKNDFLIAISTSGNSKNIINLVMKAKEIGLKFIILTGLNGGKLGEFSQNCLFVPSEETAIIQQMHISILHLIVEISEKEFI